MAPSIKLWSVADDMLCTWLLSSLRRVVSRVGVPVGLRAKASGDVSMAHAEVG